MDSKGVLLGVLCAVLGGGQAIAADQAISGKKLLVKSGKLVMVSKDLSINLSGSNPVTGADSSLKLYYAGGEVTFDLPANNWSANGSSRRFQYKNVVAPHGPSRVKIVKIKPGLVTIVVKGSGVIPPNGPEEFGVELTIGDGTNKYCTSFSGVGDGIKFLVKDAPAAPCRECGDNIRNTPAEACDGPDTSQCAGPCQSDCTCNLCGNGVVDYVHFEQCDSSAPSNPACPGFCRPDCTCDDQPVCCQPPAIWDEGSLSSRAVIVHYDNATFDMLSITGNRFGARGADSFVMVQFADGSQSTIQSTAAAARLWSDHNIIVDLPQNSRVVLAHVATPQGPVARMATVDHFDLDFFEMRGAEATNAGNPLNLAGDEQGRVWVNSEFRAEIAYWDPADDALHTLDSYTNPISPIYQYCHHPCVGCAKICIAVRKAIFGEVVINDGHGHMWFTEGGAEPSGNGNLAAPNHSRLVAVDTAAMTTRVIAVPGNHNSVIGVAWDELRHRIWFSQTKGSEPAKLIAFNPDVLPYDDTNYDWVPTATCNLGMGSTGVCSNNSNQVCRAQRDCILADRLCGPGMSEDDGCFTEYDLPETVTQPAEITVHPDGSVWFATYALEGKIGRLIPESPATPTIMPLSPPADGHWKALPWDIQVAPNGDVVTVGWWSSKIARVSPGNFAGSCSALIHPDGVTSCEYSASDPGPAGYRDPKCFNPCISEVQIPGTFVNGAEGAAAAIYATPTPDGRVYFDQGYQAPNGEFVYFPQVIGTFPNDLTPEWNGLRTIGSISYVSPTGTVWGTDFWSARLVRLTPRPFP